MTPGPKTIPGLRATRVISELERHGFGHRSDKKASDGTTALTFIELFRWDDRTAHSAAVVQQGDGVRLISVPVVGFRATERGALEMSAAAYLGAIAQLRYDGAEPERARLWVKENIANPGAEVTIGDVVFVIEGPETDPGKQHRLTIVARGARPPR